MSDSASGSSKRKRKSVPQKVQVQVDDKDGDKSPSSKSPSSKSQKASAANSLDLQCPLCSATLANTFDLNMHVQVTHSETSRRCKRSPVISPKSSQNTSRAASPAASPKAGEAKRKKQPKESPATKESSKGTLLSPDQVPRHGRESQAESKSSTSSTAGRYAKPSVVPVGPIPTSLALLSKGKTGKRKRSVSPSEAATPEKKGKKSGPTTPLESASSASKKDEKKAKLKAMPEKAESTTPRTKSGSKGKQARHSQSELQTLMNEDGSINCPIGECKAVFHSVKACYIHTLRCDGKGAAREALHCSQCEKKFTSSQGLVMHVRTIHSQPPATPERENAGEPSITPGTPSQRASAAKASRFIHGILTSPQQSAAPSSAVKPDVARPQGTVSDLVSLCSMAVAELPSEALPSDKRAIDVKCRQCGVRLTTYALVASHARLCNPCIILKPSKLRNGHTCEECNVWFTRQRDMDTHMRQHKADPSEITQRSRTDRWRKALSESGIIPCDYEGCDIKLKTIPGMVYHFKTCKVNKRAQGEDVKGWKKDDKKGKSDAIDLVKSNIQPRKLSDLVTLCAEQLSAFPTPVLAAYEKDMDVKCRLCGVRLTKASLVAIHYRQCNPYKTEKAAGGACEECNKWFSRVRDLQAHSREHAQLTPEEYAQKQRVDKWRKSLSDVGHIPCEHEGCDVQLKTIPGMVYHYKMCRVYKQSCSEIIPSGKGQPSTVSSSTWQRPDTQKVIVCDLLSICMERICTWPLQTLFKQKDILDIKCPRCRVRLVSLHLIAIHFKSCNPYAEKLERMPGYTCEECNQWFHLRRNLDSHANEHKKIPQDEVEKLERVEKWRSLLAEVGHVTCVYENCDVQLTTLGEANHHHGTCKIKRKALSDATQAMLAEQRIALKKAATIVGDDDDDDEEEEEEKSQASPRAPVDNDAVMKKAGPQQFNPDQVRFWHMELQHNGAINCLTEGCNARLRSMPAIKYHVKVCYKFTAEDCTCTVCGKVVAAPRLLGMHMRTHGERKTPKGKTGKVDQKASSSDISGWSDDVLLLSGRRRSAMKCMAKGFTEKRTSSSDDSGSDDAGSSLQFSHADTAKFAAMVKKNGEIACPGKRCDQVMTSMSALKYHCQAHHPNLLVQKSSSRSKKKRRSGKEDDDFTIGQKDLDIAANSEAEDDAALESVPSDNDDSDASVSEGDEDVIEVKPSIKPRSYPSRREKRIRFDTWPDASRKLSKAIRCNVEVIDPNGKLFPSLVPHKSDWSPVAESEVTEYLSVVDEVSPPFCCNQNGDRDTMPRFTSGIYSTGSSSEKVTDSKAVLNVGGAAWSMDWCPTPVSRKGAEQFIMVSVKRSTALTRQAELLSGRGLLQLWSCGTLSENRLQEKPSVALTICHDFGYLWHARWCPSGVWQDPTTKFSPGVLPRLGILAFASTDGSVGLISVPHPSSLPQKTARATPPAYRVKTCARLRWTRSSSAPVLGQSVQLSWHPRQPHRYIAAGFAFGTVGVWDLQTSSPLLVVNSPDGLDIYAQRLLSVENSAVRAVSWCPGNDFFLAVGFQNAAVHVWDMRSSHHPVYSMQMPGPITTISWMGHWPALLVGCDGSMSIYGESLFAIRWRWNETTHTRRLVPAGCGTTMSISDISSCGVVAVGGGDGSVTLISLPPLTSQWPECLGIRGLYDIKMQTKGSLELEEVEGATTRDRSQSLEYAGAKAFRLEPAAHLLILSSESVSSVPLKHISAKSPVLCTDITASLLPAVVQVKWNNVHSGWLATATASGLVIVEYHSDLS